MVRNLFVLILVVAVLGFFGYWYQYYRTGIPFGHSSSTPSPTPVGHIAQKNIFLVAIGDEGKSGTKIGCGDSLVGVPVVSTDPQEVLEELLSLKTEKQGLYSALSSSSLSVDSFEIENGTATVYLTGTISLGGVCDNPRFEEQIQQTLLQFPSIQKTEIYINSQPMSEVLSEK